MSDLTERIDEVTYRSNMLRGWINKHGEGLTDIQRQLAIEQAIDIKDAAESILGQLGQYD